MFINVMADQLWFPWLSCGYFMVRLYLWLVSVVTQFVSSVCDYQSYSFEIFVASIKTLKVNPFGSRNKKLNLLIERDKDLEVAGSGIFVGKGCFPFAVKISSQNFSIFNY